MKLTAFILLIPLAVARNCDNAPTVACQATVAEGESCGGCIGESACSAGGEMFAVCGATSECYNGVCSNRFPLQVLVDVGDACDISKKCCVRSSFGHFVQCDEVSCMNNVCVHDSAQEVPSVDLQGEGDSCSGSNQLCEEGLNCVSGTCLRQITFVNEGDACGPVFEDGRLLQRYCENGYQCSGEVCIETGDLTPRAWGETCDFDSGTYCEGDKMGCYNGLCKLAVSYSYYDQCNPSDAYGTCPPGFSCTQTPGNSSVHTCQRTNVNEPWDTKAYYIQSAAVGEPCGMGIKCAGDTAQCKDGVCVEMTNFCVGGDKYVGLNGVCTDHVNYDLFFYGTLSGPLVITVLIMIELGRCAGGSATVGP